MIVIVLSFIPGVTVQRLVEILFHGSSQLWLLFTSRSKGDLRLASLVHAVDGWGQVALVDVTNSQRSEEEPAWLLVPARLASPQLVAEPEQSLSGYPLLERLVRSLRILWPVAVLTWVPGVGRLGRLLAPGEETATVPQEVGAGR
jgi:hypothetical protein